ncbi:uncharacterized protein K452DRAFT_284689 [Aplosporella prunicola CBS 121167]|uniref:Uncharacterized protein n=1 Tax=Aplosporella prunicola CBS 121167 TaxID=1176127 RepID=A0A6A6BLT6_9PEZI|nr:uncharacterized protein K452DRAFT_284689 [Aplosporella prunicola CBS 121167]KAF2144373.1 hypothetical protein K452DRAFT_284689 [Aplosporella prunicola CBS 121167]
MTPCLGTCLQRTLVSPPPLEGPADAVRPGPPPPRALSALHKISLPPNAPPRPTVTPV